MRKNQNISNGRRILGRLLNLKEQFHFDIYDYRNDQLPGAAVFLLVLHKNNGTIIRKVLAKSFSAQDSNAVYMVNDSYQSQELLKIKAKGQLSG
ncbi:hypothetical protein ACFSJM_06525 [Lactococcus formosensis subsp. bovis]|uniref:hypothetical protein n=1 Tax=Lactococcus formosensis TaxID=1281486 RepID=UPI001BCDB8F8|nr:hypothetical protein [Lactococcus formosensis]